MKILYLDPDYKRAFYWIGINKARSKDYEGAVAAYKKVLELNPFLGGTRASFADYSVFGAMMWARITSSFDILEEHDPITDWRERMLDLYDGLARKETARG